MCVQYEGNNNIRERGRNVKSPSPPFPFFSPLSFRVLHSGHNARGRTEKSNLFVSPNNIRVRKTRYFPLICSHYVKKGDNSNINLSQFQDFCGKCLLLHCEYDVNFLAACSTKETNQTWRSQRREMSYEIGRTIIFICATFVPRDISSHKKIQQSDRHELPNNYCPPGVDGRIWSESRDGTVTDDNDDCQGGEKGEEFHEVLLNTFRHIFLGGLISKVQKKKRL